MVLPVTYGRSNAPDSVRSRYVTGHSGRLSSRRSLRCCCLGRHLAVALPQVKNLQVWIFKTISFFLRMDLNTLWYMQKDIFCGRRLQGLCLLLDLNNSFARKPGCHLNNAAKHLLRPLSLIAHLSQCVTYNKNVQKMISNSITQGEKNTPCPIALFCSMHITKCT